MRLLIQKVKEASVSVENRIVGEIGAGYLLFLGVQKGDSAVQADFLARKVNGLRIFKDEQGKMNLSISDVGGQILVVSQFTLVGDTSRGNRPGFDTAARPEDAKVLYEYFIEKLKEYGHTVETGVFQEEMLVSLVNDGPSTFLLEK